MTEQYKRPATQSNREYQLLRKHHQFLKQSSDSEDSPTPAPKRKSKGETLAKQYYDQLYKQYALVNLQRFQKGQIGCRWRTEAEVIQSKGQKICAELTCPSRAKSVFQMNFGYMEEGQKKNALVKVSVCEKCSFKLNYKKVLQRIS